MAVLEIMCVKSQSKYKKLNVIFNFSRYCGILSFTFILSRLFAKTRTEINSRLLQDNMLTGEKPLAIVGATSNHSIRQASLKEAYTSTTNMWKGDIYSKSLRNVIRILLRIHLAPIRMARYKKIKQRKAREMQIKREQKNLNKRRNRTLRLMNELGMAVINNRPTFVVQKISEKLKESLDTPIRNLDKEIQNESELDELDELDIAIYTTNENDDDGIEEIEEEEVAESEVIQETSAKTIRALLSIVRMLIESGKIHRVVTCDDIQHAAFKGTTFTEKEKLVAAKIVNFIRPFVQQRADDNKFPEPHILTRAPLVALANAIAIISGFPSLVRKLSITSKQSNRALHLTASGIYDTFRGQWDIPVGENWITNSYQAGRNKIDVFRAFLNMSRIESIMDSYGLRFTCRLIFVNKWTVRLLGKAKSGKNFVKSNYEEKKKGKTNNTLVKTLILNHSNIELKVENLETQVKNLTCTLKPLRKDIQRLVLKRMDIGRKVRRRETWDPGSADYKELIEIRREIATKQLKTIKLEKELAKAKSKLYSLNKALRTTNSVSTTENVSPSSKKISNEIREDYIEQVRFTQYYCLFIA